VPFNYEPVIESVKKTGRLILSGDANSRGSYLNDLASKITELAFDYLDAPPVVVGSRNWIVPAHELEDAYFPQAAWFLDAIHEKIIPLRDYIPGTNFTSLEQLRRAKAGV
jgi:2-oxoisovalerate dehydrogenase E1 component